MDKKDEIELFIESVDQVLNSNTVYIQYDLPSEIFDVGNYVKELFVSDKFFNSLLKIDTDLWEHQQHNKTIPNIEFNLLPISFIEFRNILIDMLAVKNIYFWCSPYRVNIAEKTCQYVVDNFIEASINYASSEPYSKNIKQIEDTWQFYSMPRDRNHGEDYEREFLENINGQTYRPMSWINTDNFLGGYFCFKGLDSFLIFYNKEKIAFLMTNGGD